MKNRVLYFLRSNIPYLYLQVLKGYNKQGSFKVYENHKI